MEQDTTKQEVQKFLEILLASVGLTGEIIFQEILENKVKVLITTEADQKYLIGKYGSALEAIQQIMSNIARKNNSAVQYRVDINNYKEEKKSELINKVEQYIEEKADDSSVLLWPMSSYERRVVHEHFLQLGTSITESEDFGTGRVVRVTRQEA